MTARKRLWRRYIHKLSKHREQILADGFTTPAL